MNAKKLFLGLLAIVFAVGTAYASLLTPVTYYVKAFNGAWSCEPVTVDPDICDLNPGSTCQITIQLTGGGGTGTVIAHPDNMCAQSLNDNSANSTIFSLDDENFNPEQVAD